MCSKLFAIQKKNSKEIQNCNRWISTVMGPCSLYSFDIDVTVKGHTRQLAFPDSSALHYSDFIMSEMASQIISVSMVCSTVFRAQFKENIKAPRRWPLWGEFTGDRWIPPQRSSNAENVSIWWRHHDASWWTTDTQWPCLPEERFVFSYHISILLKYHVAMKNTPMTFILYQGPFFYYHGLTINTAWISNHLPNKVWDEITCLFPNFNGASNSSHKL